MTVTLAHECPIEETPRVVQVRGMFDIPASPVDRHDWSFEFPFDAQPWVIGLIVGPSGSGKTTLVRNLFPKGLKAEEKREWPRTSSVIDGFPEGMSVTVIVELLSSVGFSSPPSWLKPFRCLSTGEQFRVSLARMLAEEREVTVCDEYTSVVDRTVAQVASAAVAKTVRKRGQKFIAATCHEDVEEWLQPDWVLRMPTGEFTRRSLQRRPSIELKVVRCASTAWELFRHHHYLDTGLSPMATCFLATCRGRPCAFSAWIPHFGRTATKRREHRTVTLPDWQGVGIGNALSAFVASIYKAKHFQAVSTTSHPAMIASRQRSQLWRMTRPIRLQLPGGDRRIKHAPFRASTTFEYIGPPAGPEHLALLEP